MYPVKLLPEALRFAARLNPLTYGVDALKHVISPLVHGPMSLISALLLTLRLLLCCRLSLFLPEQRHLREEDRRV